MPYYEYPTIVYIDLETTGLDRLCHLTQLAAKCGRREFNHYVRPNRYINEEAEQLTGFYFDGESLFVRGRRVAAKPLYDVMLEFIAFLRACGGDVVLVAHNCLNFDGRHLLKAAGWVGLRDELEEVVWGFADTIPIIKAEQRDLPSYGLKNLARRFLGYTPNLHNALTDVRVLSELVDELEIPDDVIAQYAWDAEDVY